MKNTAMAQALRILGERLFNGSGNWYARQGMAHDFIKCDAAQINAFELGKVMPKPDDDGETWKAE